jgi:hypothetical protein
VGRGSVDGGVPSGGNDHEIVGLGRVLVGAGVEGVDAGAPLVTQLGHHGLGAALLA